MQMPLATLSRVLAVLVLLSLLIPRASASTITMSDLNDVVTMQTDNSSRISGVCSGESCTVTILAPTGTNGVTSGITQVFLENNGSHNISDQFCNGQGPNNCQILPNFFSPSSFVLTFDSDGEGGTLGNCPACTVVETGLVQSAGSITWSTLSGQVVDNIFLQSDVTEASAAPEPSSAMLMLAGIGLAIAYYKKSKPRRLRRY
jgi:hypothetical protein